MKAVLQPLGYEAVGTPQLADLVLINTCSVREKAESKMSSFAEDLKTLKRDKPEIKIGVTGCVAQQEKEAVLRDLPFVDLVIGPDNIDEIPEILESLEQSSGPWVRAEFDDSDTRVWKTTTRVLNPGPTAYINVMKGCDHFCSYCIVPYTRGREKSRPIADVVEDVKQLTSRGVREVTFLGQNINTFGKRAGESLHELFERVHEIPELKRIRFTTSHPGDLKDELIECFAKLPKLCSQFHLPAQSGSNRVLRGMRRFYTREQYLERVRALRQARPDMALSTDIIVGFPGESDDDFLETLDLVDNVQYENAYSFLYSPRPGTQAATRPCTLTESVKVDRLMTLQTRLREQSLRIHKSFVNRWVEILLEGPSKKDPTKWTGRISQNTPVHVPISKQHRLGEIVKVWVESATLTHLKGSWEAVSLGVSESCA